MDISSMTSRFTSSRSPNLISSCTATSNTNFSGKRKANSTGYLRSHSQIEKRRRDKMNSFVDELASLVPTCKTKSGKLDKLSILRMAVQYMKTLRGSAADCYKEVSRKPVFISDEELKHLILRAADGFLFVVDCDRGKLLFVSESVHKVLNYNQDDLTGKSLFDYLHPEDIAKVKEQLSSADSVPAITAKRGLLVKTDISPGSSRFCLGVRRTFFCRMKCNQHMEDKRLSPTDCEGFCTIHSTGYLKSWPSTQVNMEENKELDNDGCNLSCLVAVGRLHPHIVSQPRQNPIKTKPIEFVSRHAVDGKFVFVDQRVTAILAYLPQELLGTSLYDYLHEDDIAHLAECHREVLQMREKINTNCYKLKIKDGSFITLRSCWFSFMNPWTKEVVYIVSTNSVVSPSHGRPESSDRQPAASLQKTLLSGEVKPDLQTVPGILGGVRAGAGMIAKELLEIQRCPSPD